MIAHAASRYAYWILSYPKRFWPNNILEAFGIPGVLEYGGDALS